MTQLTTKLKAERIQERLKAERIQDRLKAERIQERLAALPGWQAVRGDAALARQTELPTVRAAGLLANLAAELGAAAGVDPVVRLDGRRVTVTVATAGDGLSDLDFEVAELLSLSPREPG